MNDIFETAPRRFARLVDFGAGRRAIHWLIFLLFAASMAALHAYGTFQGLKDPRAMEEAQLARNFANGEGLSTRCIRPLSLWALSEAADAPLRTDSHLDLLHPPVWPAILGTALRAAGRLAPRPATTFVDPGDCWPLAVSHLFAILSVLWVWLIARRMFDARTGTLSAVSCLLAALLWRRSGAADGFSAALFFLLAAVWFALCAVDPRRPGGAPWPDSLPVPAFRWLLPLAASAACTALAFLARYTAGAVAPAVFLYVGCARHRPRSWARAVLYLLLAALCTLPWILRNLDACGRPFGLAPLMALSGTYLFPGDALPRALHPSLPDSGTLFYALQLKAVAGLRALAADAGGFAGAGLLLALALAQFLHPFRRFSGRVLRWCLLPALLLAWISAAVFGESAATVAAFFFPLAIPYAWAFVLVLLDRLRLATATGAALVLGTLMLVSAWPFILDVVPPRTGLPYPPYYHPYITWTCDRLSPGEPVATDIPWATAWYGNTPSVLLPKDTADFAEIDRTAFRIPLVYLTTETRNRPWISDLADPLAPGHGWYRVMTDGRVPADFPLQHARFLGGTDQLLLSSRPLD
jgi:hypothetical protein